MSEYTIRWFRSSDVEGFLDLNRRVLDADNDRNWFDWKYADNPYVDHVPIVIAEKDGGLVGARAFFGLELSIGGERHTALEPCDTMVRSDHRRQGLFTRMTERAIERYRREEPSLFFNFPNPLSLPGNLKLGWQEVATLHTHYRIANPTRLTATKTNNVGLNLASRFLTAIWTAYNALRDAMRSVPTEITVRREPGVPAAAVASIHQASPPTGIHAVRDEDFYRWRFDNPSREYTTYLAEGREDRAAMIVGRPVSGNVTSVKITDVVPLDDSERPAQLALLDRIVSDYPDAALFSIPSQALPGATLRRVGFHSDGTFPLSHVGTARTHVVRSLNGWDLSGVDIRNADNWTVTFAEVDGS